MKSMVNRVVRRAGESSLTSPTSSKTSHPAPGSMVENDVVVKGLADIEETHIR